MTMEKWGEYHEGQHESRWLRGKEKEKIEEGTKPRKRDKSEEMIGKWEKHRERDKIKKEIETIGKK